MQARNVSVHVGFVHRILVIGSTFGGGRPTTAAFGPADKSGWHVAPDVKALVLRVAALFPSGILKNYEARNDVISGWPDDDIALDSVLDEVDNALFALFGDLEARLEAFLTRHGL